MMDEKVVEVEKQGKMWYNTNLESTAKGFDMMHTLTLGLKKRYWSFRNLHLKTNGSPSAGTPPKGSVYLHHEFSGLPKIYTESSNYGGYDCRLNAEPFLVISSRGSLASLFLSHSDRKGGEHLTTREVATAMKVAYSRLYQLLTDLETSGRVKVKRFNRTIVWDDELLKAVETEAVRRGWIDEPILSSIKEKTGQS